jgi:TDG/mug DNA glycosylase family protein
MGAPDRDAPKDPAAPNVLPDVLAPGLDIVFCGSAAGTVSARRGAYYAGPGNRFWPTLAATGLTPREFRPEEFRKLPRFSLGLTDLCKRASGADADLPANSDDVDALRENILRHAPRVLAFAGKRPATALLGRRVDYGWQPERLGPTCLYVLPSPSGRARAFWDERWWQALAQAIRGGKVPHPNSAREDA